MEIWILPPPAMSRWFSRIDWYLNWQLCKGLAHEAPRPSLELLRLMEENGVSYREPTDSAGKPLMVAASGRVSASTCIVIDSGRGIKTWFRDIRQLVSGLKPARVRVFLPRGTSVDEARATWESFNDSDLQPDFTSDEVETL